MEICREWLLDKNCNNMVVLPCGFMTLLATEWLSDYCRRDNNRLLWDKQQRQLPTNMSPLCSVGHKVIKLYFFNLSLLNYIITEIP